MTYSWIKRSLTSLSFSALALAAFAPLAACGGGGSSAETFCETLIDCLGSYQGTMDMCVEEVEDAVSDGRVDGDDLDSCADCLDDNTCAEIQQGDCNVACGEAM